MGLMTQAIAHRVFEPGTTGWSVDDLYDPEIQLQWSEGRFELVDGVLTKTPHPGFEGVEPLCLTTNPGFSQARMR
jgi:hypothetical protein